MYIYGINCFIFNTLLFSFFHYCVGPLKDNLGIQHNLLWRIKIIISFLKPSTVFVSVHLCVTHIINHIKQITIRIINKIYTTLC